MTKVEISFFKPTGFVDRHEVDTDDRGEAIRRVMEMYSREMLRAVNYVLASRVSGG